MKISLSGTWNLLREEPQKIAGAVHPMLARFGAAPHLNNYYQNINRCTYPICAARDFSLAHRSHHGIGSSAYAYLVRVFSKVGFG